MLFVMTIPRLIVVGRIAWREINQSRVNKAFMAPRIFGKFAAPAAAGVVGRGPRS
jgi:hypothetical protein